MSESLNGVGVGFRVLAVDDSQLSRKRFVAAPLRDAGFEVLEAENGQKGLEVLSTEQVDCVISDLLMPVMDGFAFIEQLKAQGYTGPIIVASADIQQSSRDRIEALGVGMFLNKPFKAAELVAAVAGACQSVEGASI